MSICQAVIAKQAAQIAQLKGQADAEHERATQLEAASEKAKAEQTRQAEAVVLLNEAATCSANDHTETEKHVQVIRVARVA